MRCLRIYSFVSVACSCDPTFIAYPHGLTIVRYLDRFFRLVWFWSFVFPGACAPIPLMVPAPVLVVALRSVAKVAAFSPNPQFLSLFWGFLLLLKEFSRLRLSSWAALVGWPFRSVCLSYASPFACGCWPCGFSLRPSSLVVPECVCVGPFWGGGAVSSFSPPARHGVGYC